MVYSFAGAPRLLLIWALVTSGCSLGELGRTVTGYAAKQTCSLVNVGGQPIDEVVRELEEDNFLVKFSRVELDPESRSVHARLLGGFQSTAWYRGPQGSVLVRGQDENLPLSLPRPEPASSDLGEAFAWPRVDEGASKPFEPALVRAFNEPGGEAKQRTRAVLIIQNGVVRAERYAPGFSSDSLFLGWSMSKSILNLAIGRRAQQGGLTLNDARLRRDWLGDERSAITVRQRLRMESGLKFEETYSPSSDSIRMLYLEPDMARFAASFDKEPGPAPYRYSSGTTNILSGVLRDSFENDDQYIDFLWSDFLYPLGITSAQLEFDASGTWVASSYLYATARDWAKFGKLVLADGRWNGRRFLPAGWLQESVTPTASYRPNEASGDPPGASYGMHWWLNRKKGGENWLPDVPEDAVVAWGHFGQFLVVIPSLDLIVVRLGLSKGKGAWNPNLFLGDVVRAIR